MIERHYMRRESGREPCTQGAVFVGLVLLFLCVGLGGASSPGLAKADSGVAFQALSGAEWPPFYAYGEGTTTIQKGLFVELVDLVFADGLGMRVERHYYPWKRAQREVEEGGADFLLTIPTPARARYAVASDLPLYMMYMHLFTSKEHGKRQAMATARTAGDIIKMDLHLVAHRGDGWYQSNMADAGVRTTYVDTDESLPRFIAARRADGMIDAALPMSTIIRKQGLEGQVVMTEAQFGPLNFHILVGNRSPLLQRMDELNGVIERMTADGTLARLITKYGMQ